MKSRLPKKRRQSLSKNRVFDGVFDGAFDGAFDGGLTGGLEGN